MNDEARAAGANVRQVWTIGHSNHSLDQFVALLRAHAIEVVADVRSDPYSRYTPHFDKAALQAALPEHGPRYVYLGRELGGRPDEDELYTPDDHVRYWKLAGTERFAAGLARVRDGSARFRVALMCSEEDPADCHRHKLIAQVLLGEGFVVQHIRADGHAESAAELLEAQRARQAAARARCGGAQLGLFGEAAPAGPLEDEDELWLSTRSVSRRNRRPSSSAP